MRAASRVLAAYLLRQFADAASTNATIDDNSGDSVTGRTPAYSSDWNYGPDCPGCYIQPDQQRTFGHSWHDVTASPGDASARNVSFSFNGTAIWVYGILPPTVQFATTYVNVSFRLDGRAVGTYEYDPGQTTSTAYRYNVTVYANTSLDYAEHELVITARRDVNASYFAFDWARYTYDPDHLITSTTSLASSAPISTGSTTPAAGSSGSSHSSVGPIVGGVVGGIAGLLLALLFFIFWRRRAHNNVDRIHRMGGSEARNEEIEPMSKVEPDVEEAEVREARSHGLSFTTPPSTAFTSSTIEALRTEEDRPSRGGSRAATVSASVDIPSAVGSARMVLSPGRRSKGATQRAELALQMRDMEEQVAELRRRQSASTAPSAHPLQPSASNNSTQQTGDEGDSELRRQIEALQLEVERLRTTAADEPPPAYEEAHRSY